MNREQKANPYVLCMYVFTNSRTFVQKTAKAEWSLIKRGKTALKGRIAHPLHIDKAFAAFDSDRLQKKVLRIYKTKTNSATQHMFTDRKLTATTLFHRSTPLAQSLVTFAKRGVFIGSRALHLAQYPSTSWIFKSQMRPRGCRFKAPHWYLSSLWLVQSIR